MKHPCLACEEGKRLNDLSPGEWNALRDEAVGLAGGWPSARLGSLEVRPIDEVLPEAHRYR